MAVKHIIYIAKTRNDAFKRQIYLFLVFGYRFQNITTFKSSEATYQSILDGYEPTREDDDILDQVRSRLENLKPVKR